jgi:glutamyl-tRNA synthetase
VLLKGDGMPTYHLAHLADDTLMGTTDVIRGEDWYSSLAVHIELFAAAGFPAPRYGHHPTICLFDAATGNKRKFSKRKDPHASMGYYAENGYPQDAVWEYVLTLADSKFEDWRRANPRASLMSYPFKLSSLNSNNPLFDNDKFHDISKTVISKMTAEDIYNSAYAWAQIYDKPFGDYLAKHKDLALKVFSIDRTPEKARKDIIKWGDIKELYNYMWQGIKVYESPITDKELVKSFISLCSELNRAPTFADIKALAETANYTSDSKLYKEDPSKFAGTISDAVTNIRLAITGRKNSPDLFAIIDILGREETNARLKKVL